mmetsp:Transcript_62271/g.181923  ORF Transcript_62271/g.181923 Transcript_62271/m.181923 type:complete len:222 (+) Transcript_62271:601-1266(+)
MLYSSSISGNGAARRHRRHGKSCDRPCRGLRPCLAEVLLLECLCCLPPGCRQVRPVRDGRGVRGGRQAVLGGAAAQDRPRPPASVRGLRAGSRSSTGVAFRRAPRGLSGVGLCRRLRSCGRRPPAAAAAAGASAAAAAALGGTGLVCSWEHWSAGEPRQGPPCTRQRRTWRRWFHWRRWRLRSRCQCCREGCLLSHAFLLQMIALLAGCKDPGMQRRKACF